MSPSDVRPEEVHKKQYDPNVGPHNVHNKDVASHAGLKYDPTKMAFVDHDGALVRDRFFQPL